MKLPGSTLSSWLCLLAVATLALAASFDLSEEKLSSLLTEEDTLLWGPYRSSLYFGVRPRIPRSLLSGLMWFNSDSSQGFSTFRHSYEQHDNMRRANWVQYDPRVGGRQIIEDSDCHITITIDFVKSSDGKSWAVKVHSKPHTGYEHLKTSFVWYSGLETAGASKDGADAGPIPGMVDDQDGFLYLDQQTVAKNPAGCHYKGNIKLSGASESLGIFSLEINDGPVTNKHPKSVVSRADLNPRKSHHLSLRAPNDNVWMAKDIFVTLLHDSVKDLLESNDNNLDHIPPEQVLIIRNLQGFEGNLHFIQKTYVGECEFDVIYNSEITPPPERFSFDTLGERIKSAFKEVDSKFVKHFQPLSAPFQSDKKYAKFGQEILSGLLGGLTYSYGEHLVDRSTVFDEDSFESVKLEGKPEGPFELFSLVPSRPFFPRGFYWDEGFHLLPLLKYDSDLVLEIVKSWFNLIDENGWIAREQILGPESRSRVPEDFQTQSPEIVNPPTLILAFSYIIDAIEADDDEHDGSDIDEPVNIKGYGKFGSSSTSFSSSPLYNYSREIYPKLKSHYEMFRRTQVGYNEDFGRESTKEIYRWRGRTLTHCFASGLDDYPRTLPADIAELNVDLLSWVGVMTRSMKKLAHLLNYQEDFQKYENYEQEIVANLGSIHWSDEHNTYCDVSVDEDDENIHACFKGYISLFPFLTKLLPESDVEKLDHIVSLIRNPDELWTDFGIRSLSKSDENYKTAENYWRSPIWININYLILESLQHYQEASKPYMDPRLQNKISETYKQLRLNLVENVYKQWESTGFVWEQYDDEDGHAKGAKNFLGWTSTILLIMKMPASISHIN